MKTKLFIQYESPGAEPCGFTDNYDTVCAWIDKKRGRIYFPIEGELAGQVFGEVLKTPAPDIAVKTVGVLIDELITTDIKCYMAQEVIMAHGKCDCGVKIRFTSAG